MLQRCLRADKRQLRQTLEDDRTVSSRPGSRESVGGNQHTRARKVGARNGILAGCLRHIGRRSPTWRRFLEDPQRNEPGNMPSAQSQRPFQAVAPPQLDPDPAVQP